MLRGFDARQANRGYRPEIVKVAGRESFEGRLTVYVYETMPETTRRRLRHVGERLEFFAEAGVVPRPAVVRWPTEIPPAPSGPAAAAAERCETFREAVGAAGLDPFFQRREDGSVSLPELCVSFRREGRLRGLYPAVIDGHVRTVEECLTALAAGDDIENVAEGSRKRVDPAGVTAVDSGMTEGHRALDARSNVREPF